MNLSISEKLTYTTIRIECEYMDGTTGTGTGFFLNLIEDKESGTIVPVIITNKHVIQGSIKGRLLFTKAISNNKPNDRQHLHADFDNFESLWRQHPDSTVDLCAMPIAPFLIEMKERNESIFYMPLELSLIPSHKDLKNLCAIEDILMVGYPNGIWDRINNKPIFRRGITATHPRLDYNGKNEFMIDAACFPGSSGSPVFLFNEGSYRDNKGNTHIGSRIMLLGVLYAGPQHTAKGEIEIIDVPTIQKPVSISRIPNNLGLVIKSERILELQSLF